MPNTTEPTTEEATGTPPAAPTNTETAPEASVPVADAAPSEPEIETLSVEEILKEADDRAKAREPVQATEPAGSATETDVEPSQADEEKALSADDLQSAIDQALKDADARRAAMESVAETPLPPQSGAPVTAVAEPSVHDAPAPNESDDEFAAPETVIAQEEAAPATPTPATPAPASPAVQTLDAELAARAKAALEAESDAEPIPARQESTASSSVPPAPMATSPTPSPAAAPAPTPAPKAAAPATPAPSQVVDFPAPARPSIVVRVKSIPGRSVRSLSDRYARLGEGPRKIITLSAWGTLVQAAVLWTWIIFVRAADIPQAEQSADTPSHATAQAHAEKSTEAAHEESQGH